MTGRTFSFETSFPDGDGFGTLPGPDRTYAGSSDTFIVKVRPAGTGLIYAGYLGGSAVEIGMGDWTGDGRARIGQVTRNTALNTLTWFLDRNANGVWQGCSVDLCRGPFGAATDTPVAGAW